MQTTELDPSLSAALQKAGADGLLLVIANKNYSSWSMRPWVAMTAFGIPFKELKILLRQADTANQIGRAAHEVLRTAAHPSTEQIRHGLEGNLCRCTGYQNIVRAVQAAAGDGQ